MTEYAWFDIGDGRSVYRRVETLERQASDFPRPFIASDTMEPTRSQLDGRYYTSKSSLRETYKAAGVIEVGNDQSRFRTPPKPLPDREGIRTSIKTAMEKAAGV